MIENQLEPLENRNSKSDKFITLGTAFLSNFGLLGTTISTIISESFSSAQTERIVDYINELNNIVIKQGKDINTLKDKLEELFKNPTSTILFENAFIASAHTNSNILHHCYAFYIFNAVEEEELEYIQR